MSGLAPGGDAKPLSITITNNDNVTIKLLELQINVDSPAGCSGAGNLVISGLGKSNLIGASNRYEASAPGAPQFEVAKKNGKLTLPGVSIRMLDTSGSQDVCKARTFTLSYSGTASQGSGVGN